MGQTQLPAMDTHELAKTAYQNTINLDAVISSKIMVEKSDRIDATNRLQSKFDTEKEDTYLRFKNLSEFAAIAGVYIATKWWEFKKRRTLRTLMREYSEKNHG